MPTNVYGRTVDHRGRDRRGSGYLEPSSNRIATSYMVPKTSPKFLIGLPP